MDTAPDLLGPMLPDGFAYRAEFISPDEERDLVGAISYVEFDEFKMRGAVARRRVAFYGATYDAERQPKGPIPEFLAPVRARAAEWAGVAPDDFKMALINEFREGAPIGWHRDAPQYGIVAGISLLSECRMRFRPYLAPGEPRPTLRRKATHEIELQPRSAYLISDVSRSQYEHSIPAVDALRYSITFRTLRQRG